MAKIVIIAPSDAESDVKDAIKMLKAAGHDVDTEEPTPKTLLHIVLGLMGPNAYGFGANYAYQRDPDADETTDDPDAADDASSDGTAGEEDLGGDLGGDDFNFESLGTVSVDGELIEAIAHNGDTSLLCVERLSKGAKTTYALNESIFSFWPASADKPQQRVEVLVDKHRTSVELPIVESSGNPVLKVGKDLRSMFGEAMGMSDEVAAKKIFDKIKGEPNLKSSRVKALVKEYLPMVNKNETDLPHLHALVLSKLQDADLM